MPVSDAEALTDAAARDDAEGVQMVLLGNDSQIGYAWFHALFSCYPTTSTSREYWQGSEMGTDGFPHVNFANSHVILEKPYISLRVLLLLPASHCLPWRALHAVIERILRSKIVERHAMSYLTEMRRFISRTYSDFLEGSIEECFLKEQMRSLVQAVASPLIFREAQINQTYELSNSNDNQHILLLLEIIPSLLSTAHRIDRLSSILQEKQRKDSKYTSNFVAVLCDTLFALNSSIGNNAYALQTTHILPFSTLLLNCASFLHPIHWENVRNRILVSLLSREGSRDLLRYAELLRIIFAILALRNEQTSAPRSETDLPQSNTTYYGWEYVIFVLYATAYRTRCCEKENIHGVELVLLSEMAQLSRCSVVKMMNFIQFAVSDMIPSMNSENHEFKTFNNTFGFDDDVIFWVCCNLTLICFKSQDAQRSTLQLAVSALNIPKSYMMDRDEEVVKTMLAIVNVKALLIKSEPADDSKESYRIGRMIDLKATSILSKQQLVRFTHELSMLSKSFYFSSGGKCYLETCADNGSKAFSKFLFSCAEVVYQTVHSGHGGKDANCSCHDLVSRSAWNLLAVHILSWIPTSNDIIQLYLLAISIITCIFLETPASRAEIVHFIAVGLSQGTSSEKVRASIFCSLFNVIVRSTVSHPPNRYLLLGPNKLYAVLEPILCLINANIVLMDHEIRNSLLRTALLLPSARRKILSLGQELLVNHKRGLKQGKDMRNNLSVALDVLLELLSFNRLCSERETSRHEVILILNEIILFEKFSLSHSEIALLFQKLTEMARTRILSQLCSLQLLRLSLRKLILYFVSPENPSTAEMLQKKTSDGHCNETNLVIPTRRCFASRCEYIPGLLHFSLTLAVACDYQFIEVILCLLQESLGMKVSPGNLKHVEALNEHLDCHSIANSVTLSICRALLSSLLSEKSGASNETNEEKDLTNVEYLNYQATLAVEFERECVSLNLPLPPACELLHNNIIEDSTVRNRSVSTAVKQAFITSLRFNCFDVIVNTSLCRHKHESASILVESETPAELLRSLDYFFELHPKSLDADVNSRVRLDSALNSALNFFYLALPFDGSFIQYPFATQYYCTELHSALHDEANVESSFDGILVVVDSLFRSYVCTFCDRPSASFFSGVQSLNVERKSSSKSEVHSADLMCSMISLICKCLLALKRCLPITDNSLIAYDLIKIRHSVFGEESREGMPWLNLIYKVCADIDVALDGGPDQCAMVVHQLKVVEGSLDFISLILPLCKLSHKEVEELNGLCSGICTLLWTIACKRKTKYMSFLKPTLRLLILRVPFLTANMNTSHIFLTSLPTNGRHFIMKAAQQCFSYLKLQHKEERPSQWHAKITEESADPRESDALSFGTIDEWSSCLDIVLSAFDQIWVFMNKIFRNKAPTSTEVDRNLSWHDAVNIKNDLESMLVTLCDFLGEADKVKDHQQSGCILYAQLLSPRSKNLLSTILDRVAQTIKSAVKYLHQGLGNASNNEVSVVYSISCLASLVDNSKVPCSKKDFAGGTRKWFDLERKRGDALKKTTSLACRDNYSSFLGRLPAVLFRIELCETSLQCFSASFRLASRIRSNSYCLYENLWQNVQCIRKKSRVQKQSAKCDSIVLKSLSNYFSTAKQSGSFGMAIILDNGNEEDGNSLSESNNAADYHDNDLMYSLFLGRDSRRKKRSRMQSLRKAWNKRHISVPRSRNKAVDDWLQSDSDLGDDTFADLEDFLVPG